MCYVNATLVLYSMGRALITEIERDNVDLPLVSSGATLTLRYSVDGVQVRPTDASRLLS